MNAHSVHKGYTKNTAKRKKSKPANDFYNGKIRQETKPVNKKQKKHGGEDRTRTCKRFLAVVFKTTALPIRLPLHPGALVAYSPEYGAKSKYSVNLANKQSAFRTKKPGRTPTAGKWSKEI